MGIQIEDKGKEASIWKSDDPKKLLKKRDEALAAKAKVEEEKRARKELDLKKKSTPGKDWFKTFQTDKYSQFDAATGLPTHNAKGKALSKEILNKVQQEFNKQEAVYQKWLASQEK